MTTRDSCLKSGVGVLIIITLVTYNIFDYVRNSTRRWFSEDLPALDLVKRWNESELDTKLHELSRWDTFSSNQFQSFVEHQIHGLAIKNTDQFRYLEVGVGVGAFARHILKKIPKINGIGHRYRRKSHTVGKGNSTTRSHAFTSCEHASDPNGGQFF